MMAHNVYQHIESVQRANLLSDTSYITRDVDMLDWRSPTKGQGSMEIDEWTPRNLVYFNTFIDELFKTETPMQYINDNSAFLSDLSRGSVRKASNTVYGSLFDESEAVSDAGSEHEFDEDEAFEILNNLDK